MTSSRHLVALLQSHIAGDEQRFITVATQIAAQEARQGHGKVAQELRELIEAAKGKAATVARRGAGPVLIAQPLRCACEMRLERPASRLLRQPIAGDSRRGARNIFQLENQAKTAA